MGKNRDRLSIVAAILDAANTGASKTHIMFSANLSFSMLEKYLDIAIAADFLKLEEYKYVVTERGHQYLRHYKHFQERYSETQRLLDNLDVEREKLAGLFQRELRGSVDPVLDAE